MKIRDSVLTEKGGRRGHGKIETLRLHLQPDVEGHQRVFFLPVEPDTRHTDATETRDHVFQQAVDGTEPPAVVFRQPGRLLPGGHTVQMVSIPVEKKADVGLIHGIKIIVELGHSFFFCKIRPPRGRICILARLAKTWTFGKKYRNVYL